MREILVDIFIGTVSFVSISIGIWILANAYDIFNNATQHSKILLGLRERK